MKPGQGTAAGQFSRSAHAGCRPGRAPAARGDPVAPNCPAVFRGPAPVHDCVGRCDPDSPAGP